LAASAYLESVNLRCYEEIFDGEVLPRVISDASPGLRPAVPWRRFLQALLAALGVAVNCLTISRSWLRSLPAQQALLVKVRSGTNATEYFADWEEDMRVFFQAGLVWWELGMLAAALGAAVSGLSRLARASVDGDSPEELHHWIAVSDGFQWLSEAMTVSAMRLLPFVKARLPVAVRNYKLFRVQLKEDDGVLSIGDRLCADAVLLAEIMKIVMHAALGCFALYLKLDAAHPHFNVSCMRWGRDSWLYFFGVANQVAGLVPLAKLQKEAFLTFVFSGEDAEMQEQELRAMREFMGTLYQHIFKAFPGVPGFAASLTITASDLQKIVVCERQHLQKKVD